MGFLRLSKKEYKYRYKLFYERHLKKDMQLEIDKYCWLHGCTYEELYCNPFSTVLLGQSLQALTAAFNAMSFSAQKVARGLRALSGALDDWAANIRN